MDRNKINDIIDDIMINDGPDGHCDGSGIITSFILALLSGNGEQWYKNYSNPEPPAKPLSKEASKKFDKLLKNHDNKKRRKKP